MSRFVILLFLAAACASGCSSLDQGREKETHLAQAVAPEQTTVNATPEPDPAQAGFQKPADVNIEQRPFSLQASESIAQQVPGNPSAEKGHGPGLDSCLIHPNEWTAFAGNRQQPMAADLWSIGFAGANRPLLDNGWLGTKKVSVGITEMPNNSLNDSLKAVTAGVKVTHAEDRAWLFGWTYSGTGKQPYPVPRIQHTWHISERVRLNAGVVFPNMVDPTFDVSVSIRR